MVRSCWRILAEQRRYDEAEAVLTPLLTHYPDPSAVKGRLAWPQWHKGRKPEAIKRMQAILGDAPWYRWGWAVLMEWIMQDKAWNLGRIALRDIPSPFRGDTNFRKQRLGVLEKCSLSDPELESEWQGLLKDFKDVPLHLQRYDSLRTQRRFDESAKLLRNVESFDPNNPFLRARLAEVLLSEQKYSEAIDLIRAVWFQEIGKFPMAGGLLLERGEECGCSVARLSRRAQFSAERIAGHASRFTRSGILRSGRIDPRQS